jgi:ABC-type sugar transport system permease subunit
VTFPSLNTTTVSVVLWIVIGSFTSFHISLLNNLARAASVG